ncbi:hypothetical protein HPB50_009256 [Hyalomma asiaticum]|uniref:Uncharacterized protein n=1 Tax=Hyalomma asiaticum TaxID=266040 RepID=A0ACB7TEZ3_HYAAI|nr:hypothetical protein HPB50_009256 [Hyalomma asiaticum]
MDRSFKKKRKTEIAYGKRKRRTPNPRRSRVRAPSRQSIAESDATLDPQSSRDEVNNAGEVRRRGESSSEDDGVDATVHRCDAAHSPNEEDRAVQIDGETGDGEMTDAPADAVNQRGDAAIVPSERRTIQGHIQPSFVSAEAAEAQSTTVRESLGAMSATERKFALTTTTTPERTTTPMPGEEEYVMMQMGVLNAIIGNTLCSVCHEKSLVVDRDTRHGLAVKMLVTCRSCGSADTHWSSPRKPGLLKKTLSEQRSRQGSMN